MVRRPNIPLWGMRNSAQGQCIEPAYNGWVWFPLTVEAHFYASVCCLSFLVGECEL